jgi:hypothetical protein
MFPYDLFDSKVFFYEVMEWRKTGEMWGKLMSKDVCIKTLDFLGGIVEERLTYFEDTFMLMSIAFQADTYYGILTTGYLYCNVAGSDSTIQRLLKNPQNVVDMVEQQILIYSALFRIYNRQYHTHIYQMYIYISG